MFLLVIHTNKCGEWLGVVMSEIQYFLQHLRGNAGEIINRLSLSVDGEQIAKAEESARKRKDKQKAYEAENREKILAYKAEYRATHKEQLAAGMRNWYERNRAKVLADRKEYRATHKEQYREYMRKYREEHREEIRAKQREWEARKKAAAKNG